MPKITLKQLADAAKVSLTAASYAVNQKPGISEEKRKHVLAVAARLGYTPDAKMHELMAHVSTRRHRDEHSTLAMITRYARARVWEVNPSVLAFFEGAKKRASELGYRLEEFRYDAPDMTAKRLREILISRGIRGLLFSMAPTYSSELALDFDFSGFSAAMSGICFEVPAINYVAPDHFRNMLLALKRSHELGYRRPLLALPGGSGARTGHLMEAAYLYFAHSHPDTATTPIFLSENYEIAPLRRHIEQNKPDVVICTFGEWGYEFADYVPKHFGWISLNWMPGDSGLAGVDRRLREQAGFVVDMVVAVIHRGEGGVPPLRKEVLVPGLFVDGPSLPLRT